MAGTGSYTIRAERWCNVCKAQTSQTSERCRYSTPEGGQALNVLVRTVTWFCEWCTQAEEEVKQVPVPTDRLKIIRRFLSLGDDYDVLGLKVEARPDELVFRVRLPNFDMGELRAIQWKQQETGFISCDELMRVQRAGYKRPSVVPAKPQPRDVATLRKRERQQGFSREPRPYP
jgi:hypothetical protein